MAEAVAAVVPPATSATAAHRSPDAFVVQLDVFEGPFDLLLALISKHQLDVTEVALSKVTDDFIGHLRALGAAWDLGQATEFLVVGATLLDLKAARLLPGADVEDEEDLALLEARDLLFARLLQYRAYKQAAAHVADLLGAESRRYPRRVSLEPRFAGLLPEVLLGLGPQEFAALAAKVLRPRPAQQVAVDHAHGGTVSVREQTAVMHERLRRAGSGSFRGLTADCASTLEVVARFLGLLELYREGLVCFDQAEALGELRVRWTGPPSQPEEAGGSGSASTPAMPPGRVAGAEWDVEEEAGPTTADAARPGQSLDGPQPAVETAPDQQESQP